jgi:intein/homing endonuclease
MVEKILSSSEKIFGKIDSRLYFGKDNTFHLDFPKISGLIIIRTGLSPGFKHKTNPKIPEFIFDKDKKIKAAFLKQFFSDEGNVRLKDRRLQVKQTVSVKASKDAVKVRPEKFYPNVLIGCQKLLSDFGIDSKLSLGAYRITPHGKKTDWELSFYRIENLKIFQKEIGFEQEYKNQLLEKAVKSYKFPSTARNKKLEFALEKCRRAEEKFGFIDKKKLAEESNRSLKTATYYLVELKKKGLVEIISKPKRKDGRYRLFKYKTKQ